METSQIEGLIGSAWLAMLVLAFVIFFFNQHYKRSVVKFEKEKQKLLREKEIAAIGAAVEAEEKHKAQIANDLHDETVHSLTALKQVIAQQGVHNAEITRLLDETILGVKRIALKLIPKTLVKFGLIKTLEQHAMILNDKNERVIEVENNSGFEKNLPFSKKDEVTIYRICLEVLNNLSKHSKYTYLLIGIEQTEGSLSIEFIHNGLGVSNQDIEVFSETTSGLGLKSLQTRLLILNASIDYSVEAETSTIHISIPFSSED